MAPRMKVETNPTTPATASKPKVEKTAPQPDPNAQAPAPKPSKPKVTIVSAASQPTTSEAPASTPTAKPTTKSKPTPAPSAAVPKQPASKPTVSASKPKVTVTTVEAPPVPEQETSQPEQEEQPVAKPTGKSFSEVRGSAAGWVHRTFPGHEHAFYGGVIALLLALLVFLIGLPRVLLICVLVFVGVAVGQVLDGDPKIIRTIRGLFDNDGDRR